jgi:hypothetical protein
MHSEVEKLTKAQHVVLERAQHETKGVAGSEWYFASSLGGLATVRSCNRRGWLRMKDAVAAGGLYAITDTGRRAIAEQPQ